MANPEHVEVVRQGAAAIAEWRAQHPFEELDLSATELRSINLDYASLDGANLSNADLGNASLVSSDLSMANLSDANLSGANLDDAKLSLADLTGADLRYADLANTNLTSAKLADANLTEIEVAFTVFGDVDLSTARGLSTVTHLGPSIIDHRTLENSGQLPLEFLRGVGLPDEVIQFYEAQYGSPIQFYSSFISYARTDGEFVDRLHADLQESGVRCWRDTEDMKIGDRMRPVIDRAIRTHDKLVLVLSEHSIDSNWVESEVETAFEKEREQGRTVLFPIRLDDSVMETDKAWAAEIRRTRNIGDFREWKDHDSYQSAFERVLRDLRPDAE